MTCLKCVLTLTHDPIRAGRAGQSVARRDACRERTARSHSHRGAWPCPGQQTEQSIVKIIYPNVAPRFAVNPNAVAAPTSRLAISSGNGHNNSLIMGKGEQGITHTNSQARHDHKHLSIRSMSRERTQCTPWPLPRRSSAAPSKGRRHLSLRFTARPFFASLPPFSHGRLNLLLPFEVEWNYIETWYLGRPMSTTNQNTKSRPSETSKCYHSTPKTAEQLDRRSW